eukprot:1666130-Prymnesium_polylepis.1
MKRIDKEAAENVAADVAQDKALSARHENPSTRLSSSSQASARQGGTSLSRSGFRCSIVRSSVVGSKASGKASLQPTPQPGALSSPRGSVTETVSSTA